MRLLWRSAYLAELKTHLGEGAVRAAGSVGLSPATDKTFPFESAGSLVSDATLDSLANAADAVAAWALSDEATAASVFGCAARTISGPAAEACFSAFLAAKGPRLLRRALTAAEVDESMDFFRAQAGLGESEGQREGFRQGLASLLIHPDFLYLRDAPAGSTSTLDPYSLAARLSFALTGQGPDDRLFAAAHDGSLSRPETLAAEVERLLATPEARQQALRFYRQWLGYDAGSVAYSAAFLEGLEVGDLKAASTAELDALLSELTWDAAAAPSALLTSRKTMALPANLAQIYGVPAGSRELPAGRAGILTRVGLLSTGSDNWHVVARGLTVAQKLLCKPILPPSFSVADAVRQAESLKVSNIDRINTVTQPVGCAGCHSTINPLGGAQSDFDALGRAVTIEKHYAGGALDYQVPVVARADLSGALGRPLVVEGTAALSLAVAESPEFVRCFSAQYVRYALGRSDASDACLATDAAIPGLLGGTILDIMRAAMTSPELILWRE